jgi:hypothetical protein
MLGVGGRRNAELVEEASKVEIPSALIEKVLEHRRVLLAEEEDLRAMGERGDAHEGIPGWRES